MRRRPVRPAPPAIDAADYLHHRLEQLDNTYHDSWPRWTYRDFVAVSEVLRRLRAADASPGEQRDDASS